MLNRFRTSWVALALVASLGPGAVRGAVPQPLDPLSKTEIETTTAILKASGKVTAQDRFAILALREPDKAQVLASRPMAREALAIVFNRARNQTFRAVVDVTHARVESWDQVPGVQPAVLIEEYGMVAKIVRHDPGFIAAMQRRGIKDMEDVQIDAWATGYRTPDDAPTRRLLRCIFDYRGPHGRNPFNQPIEGVTVLVDMNRLNVLQVTDSGVVPVNPNTGNLDEKSIVKNFGPLRTPPPPLHLAEPQGPGFQISGQEVRWQNWHFRWAMQPREGLVLYRVAYKDQGRLRSILYRASLSEMVVPYGDADGNWTFRNAFDVGEYGVGRLADELQKGKDVPDDATLLDATFADDLGKPYAAPHCVGLYETDGDILWKHYDFETDHAETRRGRKLVLEMVATVSNYDYSYNWIFGQDGSLEFKVLATGVDLTKGVSESNCQCRGTARGPEERYGTLINHHVVAPNHQHWFNMRLDFDVDGPHNSVWEVNAQPAPPGAENPYNNAFVAEETVLKTARDARRNMNFDTDRYWMVVNPEVKNRLGQPVGYMLMPGANTIPLVQSGSPVLQRAGFIQHHFWVTPYDGDQQYGGGYFPNQRAEADGLPRWTDTDTSVENKDIVAWYSFAITHIARPEDYPVMSQTSAGFKLIPFGFFGHDPALDVPNDKQ